MYQQILNIGDDHVRVVVEYSMDDDTWAVIDSVNYDGKELPVGIFDPAQIESICKTLEAGHDRVVAELNSEYRADCAADRAAFREAYKDYPLGI